MALDWDILDEDFTTIAAWTPTVTGNCTLTQATEDGRSCMKLHSPALETGGTTAQAYNDRSDPGSGTFTMEWVFKQTHFNTEGDAFSGALRPYGLGVDFVLGGDPSDEYRTEIGYDGTNYFLKYRNGPTSDIHLAMIDMDTTSWHTLRIVVEASRVTSIWFDNRVYPVEVAYTRQVTGFADWTCSLFIFGWGTNSAVQTVYVDSIKIDSTPEHPTTSPLNTEDDKIVCRYRQNGGNDGWGGTFSYDYLDTEALRIGKDATNVYSMPLVLTGATLASNTRVYDGSSTKALMKLPS